MMSEVQLFVGELRRITLLWDELWLGALGQLYQDVMRRLKQLENEMAKVSSNTMLSPEEAKAIIQKKHMTVLKPVNCIIIYILNFWYFLHYSYYILHLNERFCIILNFSVIWTQYLILFRPHCLQVSHKMWSIATDVACSVVCASVCVCMLGELCNNDWTDWDAVWGWLIWSKERRSRSDESICIREVW